MRSAAGSPWRWESVTDSVPPTVPRRVYDLIEQGHLGRKSGSGFYEYDKK